MTPLSVKILGILCTIKIVYDMFNDLSNIFNTIDNHIQNTTQLDDVCLAGAIRELCEACDSGIVQIIDCNQICNLIDLIIIQIKSGVLIIMIFKTELFDQNNFFICK